MFGAIAHRYDLANSILSFGVHHYWRRRLLKLIPVHPSTSSGKPPLVLDLCTGTGDLLPFLSHRFGKVLGIDFSLPMLQAGRKVRKKGSFPLIQGDALKIPLPDSSIDIVSISFGVRNFEDLNAGLREVCRVLAPEGRLLVLEFGQPYNSLFGSLFRWYSTNIMPRLGGLITGDSAAYSYLPRTSASFPCGGAFEKILNECGFRPERTLSLTGGVAYAYLGRKI